MRVRVAVRVRPLPQAHPVHLSGLVVTAVNTTAQVVAETLLRRGVPLRMLPLKCLHAAPPVTRFTRAVLLVRNPFACMYSETVRQLTKLHAGAPTVTEFEAMQGRCVH